MLITEKRQGLRSIAYGPTLREQEKNKINKVSRRKEIIEIKSQLNKIENRKTREQMNKTKSYLFEIINKINKPLGRLSNPYICVCR